MKLYAIQYVDENHEIQNLSNQLFKTQKQACATAIEIFKDRFDIDDDPAYIKQIYDSLYLYDIYVDKDGNHERTYYIITFDY